MAARRVHPAPGRSSAAAGDAGLPDRRDLGQPGPDRAARIGRRLDGSGQQRPAANRHQSARSAGLDHRLALPIPLDDRNILSLLQAHAGLPVSAASWVCLVSSGAGFVSVLLVAAWSEFAAVPGGVGLTFSSACTASVGTSAASSFFALSASFSASIVLI